MPGLLRYVCDGDPALRTIVRVIRVTTMLLRAAAAFLGRAADWPDAVLLDGMREHYPAITLDDAVEIVEHLTPMETEAQQHEPSTVS
ncbi:hypothetical protein [Aquibium carbonis]|uniref:hypothetical protein n=1 Tax=Aquibium carbonis TaxID=2495581 RepID=UPI001FE21FD6|nr:hypothetical protein [Aquibium carbonis]